MTLILTMTPVAGLMPLTYAQDGDVLTVGGLAYDLAPLGEGALLPRDAVPGRWLASDLERVDGAVRLTAVEAVAPFGEAEATAAGAIDWSRVETAPARAAARLGAWRASASLATADFALAALGAGLITEADAEAWVTRQAIPTVVAAAVGALPAAQRTGARLRIMGATTVRRDAPLVALLAAHLGLADAQVDVLFGGAPG